MSKQSEKDRIIAELKEVGTTGYGLKKFGIRYAIDLIREDEHIRGIVYGRYRSGSGILNLTEGMLIATDRRVLFLDHKPGFTDFDEITYDMVGGIRSQTLGPFSTVTLHTRMGDFAISYVNEKCAKIFTEYIETRRISRDASEPIVTPATDLNAIERAATTRQPNAALPFLDQQSVLFLKEHDVAVLSSVDDKGNVAGSVVYYIVDQLNQIYIVTKTGTKKAKNILAHRQVALTIFDPTTAETLNIQGGAEFELDDKINKYVFGQIVRPHNYRGAKHMPPVVQIHEGAFTVLRITAKSGKYTNYNKSE